MDRADRRRTRVTGAVGWLLVLVGAAMAVAHLIAHLAGFRVVGPRDLLLGYPMAAVLVLGGLLLIGLESPR